VKTGGFPNDFKRRSDAITAKPPNASRQGVRFVVSDSVIDGCEFPAGSCGRLSRFSRLDIRHSAFTFPAMSSAHEPRIPVLPTLMTAGNILCGFVAILQIFDGRHSRGEHALPLRDRVHPAGLLV
jgi:hypothetical protein